MAQDKQKAREARAETRLAHLGRDLAVGGGRPVNPPIVRASTVLFESAEALLEGAQRWTEPNFLQYGRKGTETHFALEQAVAGLEGGHGAIALPSGLAAIAVSLLALTRAGDHVLVADTVYAPTRAFCANVLARYGVETDYYDPRLGGEIAALIRDDTRVVFCESPGSLTFEVQDLPAIAAAAHARGVPVVADNTWATPLFCRPLELGADIVVHAGTKYIVGHSDAMLGLIVAGEAHYEALRRQAGALGYATGPDDAYLALRGLRSLDVRLRRHQDNALAVAEWLAGRPEVARVLHPALPGDPGHGLWRRDFTGASGLFGVELRPVPPAAVAALLDGLAFFGMGYSWGGYESLAIPTFPEKFRSAVPWRAAGPMLRLHIGLEAPADLIADLEEGFQRLRRRAAAE